MSDGTRAAGLSELLWAPTADAWCTASRSAGCGRSRGEAPETLEPLAELIKSSDAVIVVSGEYNHSIQPALSNLLDHFLEEWFWRPAAIACYSAGQFGGVRAAMQLQALLPELGMPSIPSILALPTAPDLFDDQGQPRADWVARRAGRFLDELEWYATALKTARSGGVPY